VNKAKEIGMDWWLFNPEFSSKARQPAEDELAALKARIGKLEAKPPGARTPPPDPQEGRPWPLRWGHW
jgi:hypothetical protein